MDRPASAMRPDMRLDPAPPARERLAARLLRGPLAVGLLALAAVQLSTWVPHYLTWPLWTDHDVFATAARAWDLGEPPYRHSLGNNFPGTTYLFWSLGKLAGWGRSWPIYALDAAGVVALGAVMLAWSHRRLGGPLPGAVGYLGLLGYLLNLDYSQAAQRDWHAPGLAVAGLMILESGRSRPRLVASAALAALSLAIRPQAVLLVPAFLVSAGTGRRALAWITVYAISTLAAFAPLATAGVLGDFGRALRVVGVGSEYGRAGGSGFLRELAQNLAGGRVLGLLAAAWLLSGAAEPAMQRTLRTWAVALAGLLLYKPISPQPHAYLDHPMAVGSAVGAAIVVALIQQTPALPSTIRLAAVALILAAGPVRPRFCNVSRSGSAVKTLMSGVEPATAPLGYTRNLGVKVAGMYRWDDYRGVLAYLREHVDDSTQVANALKGVPALCGAVDRRSALPAESVAWLRFVRSGDEPAFASRLARDADSVVVWSPAEEAEGGFRLDILTAVIRRHYEPEARFGAIEVWRRKGPR